MGLTADSMTEEAIQYDAECEEANRVTKHDLAQSRVSLEKDYRRKGKTNLSSECPPDESSVGGMSRPRVDTRRNEFVSLELLVRNTAISERSVSRARR